MTTTQNVTFDWLRLAPALAPAAAALVVLLVDAVLPGRRVPHLLIAALALLSGAGAAVPGALTSSDRPVLSLCLPGGEAGACLWVAGPVASTLQIGILASTLAILLLMVDRWPSLDARASGTRRTHDAAVDLALLLGSAAGGAAVAAARDLATWLIALELATVPVVALVALRGTRRAAHGAMSLLMTSLLSFALLVVGAGLWLVATGDPTFTGMGFTAAWMDPARRGVLVLAALTLLAGLGFKLSLIPFHAWTPPTFATAPLPITALLAATSKIAALAALLVVLTPFARVIEGTPRPHALAFGIGTLAAVSFLIGTVVAFRATEAVRLLAWSTIAQAGWVVLPLAALTASAHRAAAGYVLTYAAASLVAFAAVSAVRATTDGEPGSRGELTAYKGLVRTHPHIGGPLVLALLVLAGLPPGILGLVAKVVALRPLLEAGLWPLAVFAVIGVVVGIAVYLRWIALLLAAPDAQPQARPAVHAGPGALVVLAIGTALLIVASVVPQVLYGLLS
jgi:NADH-quinone oxidoreductase subunit N